ncbi:MAG: hypothetical protein OWR52_02410 [Acidibacillus sp.]|nr:hypothetical protein [Acidibacillus sp.]
MSPKDEAIYELSKRVLNDQELKRLKDLLFLEYDQNAQICEAAKKELLPLIYEIRRRLDVQHKIA